MHNFLIDAQSYGRNYEIFPEEPESVELMVEHAVSLVLADLFVEAIVDEVTVRFSPPRVPVSERAPSGSGRSVLLNPLRWSRAQKSISSWP